MIGFDEAFALVLERAVPLAAEKVPLDAAHRRTLAAPVVARVDHPPADVSAMDGYAVRNAELTAGRTEFIVAGESFPGAGFAGTAGPGACVRIFTGAPMPEGFDRVVIQENVRREGDVARVEDLGSGSIHVRRRGSDFRTGDVLLETGRRLDARALVAVAGADLAEVTAWRRPRIALVSTGDELAVPGEARSRPGTIPESLSAGLRALVEDWGGTMVAHRRLGDQPDLIETAAAEALDSGDLVVVTGGASVGEKDFAKPVFERLGLELIFPKVAIRPGKPVWFGRARDRLVMGLPGNPTSAMVTGRLLLAPLIAGLAGRDPASAAQWRPAPLAADMDACIGRESFVRGQWSERRVLPLSNQDSGAQKALADADVLIRRRPGSPAAAAGEPVEVLDF